MKPRELLRESLRTIEHDNRSAKHWISDLYRARAFERERPPEPQYKTEYRCTRLFPDELSLKATIMCMAVAHSRYKIHARNFYKCNILPSWKGSVDTLEDQTEVVRRLLRRPFVCDIFSDDELSSVMSIVGVVFDEVRDVA